MSLLRKFCLVASFITCLPLASARESTEAFTSAPENIQAFKGLAKYIPIVGLLLGLLLSAEATILNYAHITSTLAAILICLSWLALTGGIHLDGLMDTADGVPSTLSLAFPMQESRVWARSGMSTVNFPAICWRL